jgi:hypothetical protein
MCGKLLGRANILVGSNDATAAHYPQYHFPGDVIPAGFCWCSEVTELWAAVV